MNTILKNIYTYLSEIMGNQLIHKFLNLTSRNKNQPRILTEIQSYDRSQWKDSMDTRYPGNAIHFLLFSIHPNSLLPENGKQVIKQILSESFLSRFIQTHKNAIFYFVQKQQKKKNPLYIICYSNVLIRITMLLCDGDACQIQVDRSWGWDVGLLKILHTLNH